MLAELPPTRQEEVPDILHHSQQGKRNRVSKR